MGAPEEGAPSLYPYCSAPIVGEEPLERREPVTASGGMHYRNLEGFTCVRCHRPLALR